MHTPIAIHLESNKMCIMKFWWQWINFVPLGYFLDGMLFFCCQRWCLRFLCPGLSLQAIIYVEPRVKQALLSWSLLFLLTSTTTTLERIHKFVIRLFVGYSINSLTWEIAKNASIGLNWKSFLHWIETFVICKVGNTLEVLISFSYLLKWKASHYRTSWSMVNDIITQQHAVWLTVMLQHYG